MSNQSAVADVVKNLTTFFRHLMPGVLAVGAAYVAHPSWFDSFKADSWPHIAIGSVVAISIGNVLYSINRYGVDQFMDFSCYCLGIAGPGRKKSAREYFADTGIYVAEAFNSKIPESAREHVRFRMSMVLLQFMVAEVGFLFAFWHEPNTLFASYQRWALVASTLLFLIGIAQYLVTRYIDFNINKNPWSQK